MLTKFLPVTANKDLVGLGQTMADYLGIEAQIETRIVLHTESEQLAAAVDALTRTILGNEGGMPEQAPAKVSTKTETISGITGATTITQKVDKACEFCGAPISGNRKICGSEVCKNKQKQKYKEDWKSRKAEVIDADPEPPLAETPPIWPPMADFYVKSGPLMGTFLSRWEFLEKTENGDLAVGTRLQSKEGKNGELIQSGRKVLVQFDTEPLEPERHGAE